MSNPVLVEVLRGALVESRHTGSIAVADPEGGLVARNWNGIVTGAMRPAMC